MLWEDGSTTTADLSLPVVASSPDSLFFNTKLRVLRGEIEGLRRRKKSASTSKPEGFRRKASELLEKRQSTKVDYVTYHQMKQCLLCVS